jgi:hypothetical protein
LVGLGGGLLDWLVGWSVTQLFSHTNLAV